jgi:hypothetical protein
MSNLILFVWDYRYGVLRRPESGIYVGLYDRGGLAWEILLRDIDRQAATITVLEQARSEGWEEGAWLANPTQGLVKDDDGTTRQAVFPGDKISLHHAIPGRPSFACPWVGAILIPRKGQATS